MTPAISAQEFRDWMTRMGFSGREAARRLGTADNTVIKYRNKGAPLYIALACAALASDIPPWRKETNGNDPDASGTG